METLYEDQDGWDRYPLVELVMETLYEDQDVWGQFPLVELVMETLYEDQDVWDRSPFVEWAAQNQFPLASPPCHSADHPGPTPFHTRDELALELDLVLLQEADMHFDHGHYFPSPAKIPNWAESDWVNCQHEVPAFADVSMVPAFADFLMVPAFAEVSRVPVFADVSMVPAFADVLVVPAFAEVSRVPVFADVSMVPAFADVLVVPAFAEVSRVPVFADVLRNRVSDGAALNYQTRQAAVPFSSIATPATRMTQSHYEIFGREP
jgi:hypothetical protein